MWDEIIYPFLNFNGAVDEVWEYIINLIPHFTWYGITYLCWDSYEIMLVKEPPVCMFASRATCGTGSEDPMHRIISGDLVGHFE